MAGCVVLFCVFAVCTLSTQALPRSDVRRLLFRARLEETLGTYKAPNVLNLPADDFKPENRQLAGVTDPAGDPKKLARGVFLLDQQVIYPDPQDPKKGNVGIRSIELLVDRWAQRSDRVKVFEQYLTFFQNNLWANDINTNKVRPVLVCPEFYWLPKPQPAPDLDKNRFPKEADVKTFIETHLIPLSAKFPNWIIFPGTFLFEPDGVESTVVLKRPYYNAVPVLFNGDHKFWIHKLHESMVDFSWTHFPVYKLGLGLAHAMSAPSVCTSPYILGDIVFRTEICKDHSEKVAKTTGSTEPADLHIVIAGGMRYHEESQCAPSIWVVDHSLHRCTDVRIFDGPASQKILSNRFTFPQYNAGGTVMHTIHDVPLRTLSDNAAKSPKSEEEQPSKSEEKPSSEGTDNESASL